MIDNEGFRSNVAMIIADGLGNVLWARRVGGFDAWQFPQGGVHSGESAEDALYRELHEEVGLRPNQVKVIASTRHWLRYRLPEKYIRKEQSPLCVGQKQKWFLLKINAEDSAISFDGGPKPEFDHWRWASYWFPLTQVVDFKQDVYRKALKELSPAHAAWVRKAAEQSKKGAF